MTNTTRYRPSLLHQLHRLSQEWDQLFEPNYPEDNSLVETSHWAPCVDIKEEPERFILYADIPGVDPNDIEIAMENGVLTIKGERTSAKKEERGGYTRIERSTGSFYRRFALPDTADPDRVTAEGKHGVLEVIIPKREKMKSKKIKVAMKRD
ncbi:Hsp20/alpha crystallin family protein [Rickettsiella endosymbiont of Dermanyssus gallinae]|uniref:Hsp20/alpha crystallin family protein n=1 Tax=Rickettsiella endosymbiont of Dermanyssus gallinae TaxID=2856608 RepID=UPI001C52F40E|nr:Hsp20/alpha crystallin family protein [Rickettsiella endosymbiont of Dermanyssus gallinae]